MQYVVTVDGTDVGLVQLRFYAPARRPGVLGFGALRAGPGATVLRRRVPAPPPFAPFAETGRSSTLPPVHAVPCTLLSPDGSAVGATAVLERVGRGTADVDDFAVHATWDDAPADIRAAVEAPRRTLDGYEPLPVWPRDREA